MAPPASSTTPLRTGPFPAFPPPSSTNGSRHFTAPSANCSRWDLPRAAAWTDILPEFQALIPAMSNEPRIRVWQAVDLYYLDAAVSRGLRSGFGSDFLRVGGIKAFADGSLGSRTAYMEESWPGAPGNCGYHTYESVNWLV